MTTPVYSFDNLHRLNKPVEYGAANATFLSMLRLRDGKIQHLHRDKAIRVNVNRGLYIDVEATTMRFNSSPVGFVDIFTQCTSHKLEALEKPVILSDLGFNFQYTPHTNARSATLGLGDFIVLFREGLTPDTVIFITDRPMQVDLKLSGPTIARTYTELAKTFRRDGVEGLLRVDYALYVEYIRRCIDENFDVSEAMQGVVNPHWVSL
jgi:hypothetical protein